MDLIISALCRRLPSSTRVRLIVAEQQLRDSPATERRALACSEGVAASSARSCQTDGTIIDSSAGTSTMMPAKSSSSNFLAIPVDQIGLLQINLLDWAVKTMLTTIASQLVESLN